MFVRFKSHFTRQPATPPESPEQKPEGIHDIRGYFRPQPVDVLLATPLRRQCLQQLWQNSALPEGLYQRFYLAPIKQLMGSVQQIPAAPEGEWSGAGGFADLTLKFTTCAVRLAKGHLLPPGVAPETQAAQSVLWQAVVFWAALFYHLPLLRQVEGELDDGHYWRPGWWTPERRFRFRFRSSPPDLSAPLEAMIATRLLPEEAVSWLFLVPAAWTCLVLRLGGHPSAMPLIEALLQDAAMQVQSPLLKSAGLAERPVTDSVSIPTDSGVVAPIPESATPSAADQPVYDDTQALLSLFQSNDEVSEQVNANDNHIDLKSSKRTRKKPKRVAPAGN
ncbi:TraI domain-containing protein [Xenorhabdus anantnagensis]|uniref:TraI domain-containing protein n=1 Tax=Xenorhabdus anantnagensis TaxID=3025875 RepID=A0ABT5LXN3_9GAMM|nr:TraI domain-containing protein [Xenorhabdus anantnagensis]MDC9597770.1 TraI domain-containing protein [Xenorhabdus anantnagensis]